MYAKHVPKDSKGEAEDSLPARCVDYGLHAEMDEGLERIGIVSAAFGAGPLEQHAGAQLVTVGPTTSCAPSLSLNFVSTSAADVIARLNRVLLMI